MRPPASVAGAVIMSNKVDPELFEKSPLWGTILTENGGLLGGYDYAWIAAVLVGELRAARAAAIHHRPPGAKRDRVVAVMTERGTAQEGQPELRVAGHGRHGGAGGEGGFCPCSRSRPAQAAAPLLRPLRRRRTVCPP